MLMWFDFNRYKMKIEHVTEVSTVFIMEHSVGTLPRSNWNLDMLVFEERPQGTRRKTVLEHGREPTTNSTHI